MAEYYFRIETVQLSEPRSTMQFSDTTQSLGGYMCSVNALLSLLLGTEPTDDSEELLQLVSESENPDVKQLMVAYYELGDIPHPDIYINDKANYICLYHSEEFDEHRDYLQDISDLLMKYTKNLVLGYMSFYLEDDEILYSDSYQIVISKETYEKHKKESAYEIML